MSENREFLLIHLSFELDILLFLIQVLAIFAAALLEKQIVVACSNLVSTLLNLSVKMM